MLRTCAVFFSIVEIKVIKNRQRPYNEARRVSRFPSLQQRYLHNRRKPSFRKGETLPGKEKAHSLSYAHKKTGNVLLSQAASHQVSSALRSLTSVFEMGTGVASSLLSPDFLSKVVPSKLNISSVSLKTIGQVFDLLVSVS